jgi:ribosomal protein S10
MNPNLEHFNTTIVSTEMVDLNLEYDLRLTVQRESSPDIFMDEHPAVNQYSSTPNYSPDLFESTSPQYAPTPNRNASPDIFSDDHPNEHPWEKDAINLRRTNRCRIAAPPTPTIAHYPQLAATPDISITETHEIHENVPNYSSNKAHTEMSLIQANDIDHTRNASVETNAITPLNSSDSSFFVIRDEPTGAVPRDISRQFSIEQPRHTSAYSQSLSPDIFDDEIDDYEINVPNLLIQTQTHSPDIFEACDNEEDLCAMALNEGVAYSVVEIIERDNGIESVSGNPSTTNAPNNGVTSQQIPIVLPLATTESPMIETPTNRLQANEDFEVRAYHNRLLNQAVADNYIELNVTTNVIENQQIDMDETHLTVAS